MYTCLKKGVPDLIVREVSAVEKTFSSRARPQAPGSISASPATRIGG